MGRLLRAALGESETNARALARRAPRAAAASLPEAAAFHRAVGFANERLGAELPADARAELDRLDRLDRARRLIVIATLKRVAVTLESTGVSFLVVKGPVLAELAYRRPQLRAYRDLDLVVPRSQFAAALRALEAEGSEVIDPNWPYLRDELAGELELTTGIDLHWHFFFSDDVRRATGVRMDDLFARSRAVEIAGTTVRTLDDADMLIHVALHACKDGGDRLIWFKDIEQIVLNRRPPWAEIVRRSNEWGVNLFVGAMLGRARTLLGVPIHEDVMAALIPSRAWRAVLRSLDGVFPIAVWAGHETPATLVVRMTRQDVRATLESIGGAAAGRAVSRSRRRVVPSAPAGDARAAFLERIASGS